MPFTENSELSIMLPTGACMSRMLHISPILKSVVALFKRSFDCRIRQATGMALRFS